jgi:hypothetical protein
MAESWLFPWGQMVVCKISIEWRDFEMAMFSKRQISPFALYWEFDMYHLSMSTPDFYNVKEYVYV